MARRDLLQRELVAFAQGRHKEAPMTTIPSYDTLVLGHNGAEWQGTYNTILGALVEDLLSDGLAIDCTVTFDNGNGPTSITGELVALTDDTLEFGGGHSVPRLDVLSITVP